jgi:hypothetical protein
MIQGDMVNYSITDGKTMGLGVSSETAKLGNWRS